MAITETMKKAKRAELMATLIDYFSNLGEDPREISANAFMFPFCYDNGEEDFFKITIQIPSGSRKDGEPFDGYGEAESWELKKRQKAEAEAKAAKAKAEKAKRDAAYYAKQKENKAKRNAG